MNTVFAGLVLLVGSFLAAPRVRAQSGDAPMPGGRTVSISDLHGDTLVLPRWNVRIPAPGPGWVWWTLPKPATGAPRNETFVCAGPEGERFVATLIANPSGGLNEEFVRGVQTGIAKTAERSGIRYSGMKAERTDRPLPGSYRLSATATLPAGERAWIDSVSGSDPVYMLQAYLGPGESAAAFDRFVSGLTLLESRPASAPAALPKSGEPVLLGVFVVLISMGLGGLVNALVRRPLVDGAMIGSVAAIVFAVGFSVLIASRPGFGNMSPEKQGELIGGQFGSAIISVALGWYFSKRFRRKKALYARESSSSHR
jgi:hypothetical protein